MAVRFHFNTAKAIQAIGVLMQHDRVGRMNYMRVIKLLYLAEREVLRETGKTIVGDSFVAMERGPVLENVYKLIREEHPDTPEFFRFFERQAFDLKMKAAPDVDELSELEIAAIHQVAGKHRDDDEWALVQFTHEHLPEWQQNDPGTSSRPIPIEVVLHALGFSDQDIQDVVDEEHRRRIASPPRLAAKDLQQCPPVP